MKILALDIGGVNIKAACSCGSVMSVSVSMRNDSEYIARQLRRLDVGEFDCVAATMTAELCDCFESKRQGVECIVVGLKEFAGDKEVGVWGIDGDGGGGIVGLDDAVEQTGKVAAGNWHVLSTYIGGVYPDERVLLVDIGSTTTDIIAIDHGEVVARGLNDSDRLISSELVYSGVKNTPVMALGYSVFWLGKRYGVMAEPFAMMNDVYLLTGDLAEEAGSCATADGQPSTVQCASRRLVRMVGGDMEMFDDEQVIELATMFAGLQEDMIFMAIRHVVRQAKEVVGIKRFDRVVISGCGEFLAARAAREAMPDVEVTRLSEDIGCEQSRGACAYGLMKLAKKHWDWAL